MTQVGERRAFRVVAAIAVAALFVGAFRGAEFRIGAFFDPQAERGARAFLSGCWPPRTDAEFLLQLGGAALDTLAIAALGTAVAILIGFPLGVLGSRLFVHGVTATAEGRSVGRGARVAYWVARSAAGLLRSVPEVVWAVLFVRVAGLGAVPAIAGLGVAYGGLIGKVFSEQADDVDERPVAALEAVGAGRVGAFAWGVLPQALGPMASYAAYRFECAIRASTIMGIVGAGGIGFRILVSESDDLYGEIVTETLVLVAIVVVVEWLSDRLRERLA